MSDFIKNGTNEEDMKGGVQDTSNDHHVHCCHDDSCPQRCADHKVPGNNEHERSNEHTVPDEVLDTSEKGEHQGTYPGVIRKFR